MGKYKIYASGVLVSVTAVLIMLFIFSLKAQEAATNRLAAEIMSSAGAVSKITENTAPTAAENKEISAALTPTEVPIPTVALIPEKNIVVPNVADPVTVRIGSIKLAAPVVRTGLEADGSLHVPGSPDLTGWYHLGVRPGELGPAVITGHYDSKSGPGVLYNLKNVKPGDVVEVVRNDESVAVFTVELLEYYLQDNFPTQKVYGATSTADLRIITCAGNYNKLTKNYSQNLVVYATLKEIIQPKIYEPL